MAWIEFHATTIKRLKKFSDFRRELGWSVHEALGFLGDFWGQTVEVCEHGEVSGWEPGYLSELTGLGPQVSEKVWDSLVEYGWIDKLEDGRLLVHDWLDYAGSYLRSKYASENREKLVAIWERHGKQYGKPIKPQLDSNCTLPNQTKEGVSVSSSNPTAEQLVEYWNRSTHPNYPRVKQITALRKTHINARLREHPDKAFWVDVVERLNKSTFLRGEGPARGNGKPWRADFDWVINPTNLAKIIEGNYDR